MLGWAVASGVGRTFVLRALVPDGHLRTASLCALQLLRIAALAVTILIWFAMVRWAALRDVIHVPAGGEPNMVGFARWLICLSLGIFTRVGAVELGAFDRECAGCSGGTQSAIGAGDECCGWGR